MTVTTTSHVVSTTHVSHAGMLFTIDSLHRVKVVKASIPHVYTWAKLRALIPVLRAEIKHELGL